MPEGRAQTFLSGDFLHVGDPLKRAGAALLVVEELQACCEHGSIPWRSLQATKRGYLYALARGDQPSYQGYERAIAEAVEWRLPDGSPG
jgi:hypothetical protein